MAEVRVFDSIDALSEAAAEELISIAADAVRERGVCHIALSGGSTPKRLFQILAKRGRAAMPWEQVHLWWGDERSVGPEHADSNFKMTKDALLDPLSLENFERIEGEADPAEAAKAYGAKLERLKPQPDQFPVFDYVMLGMGPDGHTASLFPNTPALDATSEIVVANPVSSPLTKGATTRITWPRPRADLEQHHRGCPRCAGARRGLEARVGSRASSRISDSPARCGAASDTDVGVVRASRGTRRDRRSARRRAARSCRGARCCRTS